MSDLNPYTPPQSGLATAPPARLKPTKLAKVGAWLQVLPLLGIAGTVLGMMRAFSTLTTDGAGDPSKLSAAIGEVLISTVIGFWGGLIGCFMLGMAVFVQRRQPRWVKVIFWLSVLPALNGIFMLICALREQS